MSKINDDDDDDVAYTGWPKKVSHYRESLNRINIVNQARFFANFYYKMSKKYMFVLNTLCMTQFVTSSVAMFEAAIWVKSMYMIKA